MNYNPFIVNDDGPEREKKFLIYFSKRAREGWQEKKKEKRIMEVKKKLIA